MNPWVIMAISTFGVVWFFPRLADDLLGDQSRGRVLIDGFFSLLALLSFLYGLILFGGGWPVSASCAEIPVCRMAISAGF